ncbi:MAG: hypothetical protein LC808_14495 [Actinobacteria bacterium]|nr:hypothetical protein [Actinomycetota bacterium]
MTEFKFTLTIEGADLLADGAQEALYEVGCGDATFGASNGIHTAEFDREAPDFSEAVAEAIRAIETRPAIATHSTRASDRDRQCGWRIEDGVLHI